MSVFTSSGGQQNVQLQGSANPVIVNVPMILAATEYSFDLPLGTKQFRLKVRTAPGQTCPVLQVAYNLGESGTVFDTIPIYCFMAESEILLTTLTTIYFQSSLANQILELVYWT